ncbi:MAG TPA: hypothetical protein VK851_05035 [Anaerolineales bacterium]|nr:hypothetical protein [Anaerolineales bacterium]
MNDSSVPSALPTVDEQMDIDSNLLMGLIGGGLAMLVGAVVWGAVTYFTNYQIGWMAIGVGYLVGLAVNYFGRGKTPIFGISSAVLALIGCVLGNLLFYSGLIAREEGASFMEVFFFFLLTPAAVIEIFTLAFEFMDLLFYGIAAWVGYTTALNVKRTKTDRT